MSNKEVEIVRMVEYRFSKNDNRTRQIFSLLNNFLYNVYIINPSFFSLRNSLENIINGNFENFDKQEALKLEESFQKLNVKYGVSFLDTRKQISVFNIDSNTLKYDNDIIIALKKVLMLPEQVEYDKVLINYMLYFLIKIKLNIKGNEHFEKLITDDFCMDVENINNVNILIHNPKILDSYLSNNQDIKNSFARFYKLIIKNVDVDSNISYCNIINKQTINFMVENFTKYGKQKINKNTFYLSEKKLDNSKLNIDTITKPLYLQK